jgi:hypothetical protein
LEHKNTNMIKEANSKSFDWVYYILGLFFGGLTGAVISGGFGWTILSAILGFIIAAWFLNSVVKGRKY